MISAAKQYARLRNEQLSLFEQYARRHGMNSKSMLVLMWIYYNPNGLTQENIAKHTYSTKQVVQAIVKNYMEKGVLYLEPSQLDRRKKLVRLTEHGQTFASNLLEPLSAYEEEAMATLTAQQQDMLLQATQLFSDKLKELLETQEVSQCLIV